jgi:DNA-directed RNA polymerase specialized sigma24 family protein
VLVRVRLLQLGHDEVAAELGLTPENSRQLLHRAMARLAIAAGSG